MIYGPRDGGPKSAVLLLCAIVTAPAACGSRPTLELSHTFDSPQAIARAVLEAVARRDAGTLSGLSLDPHEFRLIVWPGLPASRPEANLPVEYAWGSLHQNSTGHLMQVLTEHGGRRYELSAVRFRGESTRYRSFTVHRRTELVVRDAAGETRRVRLFGSLIEADGRWKIFSFVVD